MIYIEAPGYGLESKWQNEIIASPSDLMARAKPHDDNPDIEVLFFIKR